MRNYNSTTKNPGSHCSSSSHSARPEAQQGNQPIKTSYYNVPINVHSRAEIFLVRLAEVPHAHLPEIPRMVLVEQDPVVVETTGVTATGRMLAVLADTAMAGGHMPPLFAVLVQTGRLYIPREPRTTGANHECEGTTKPRGARIQNSSQHGGPPGTILVVPPQQTALRTRWRRQAARRQRRPWRNRASPCSSRTSMPLYAGHTLCRRHTMMKDDLGQQRTWAGRRRARQEQPTPRIHTGWQLLPHPTLNAQSAYRREPISDRRRTTNKSKYSIVSLTP